MPLRRRAAYAWPRSRRAAEPRLAAGHSLCEIVVRHTDRSVERLRLAIDCMPVATREAMLDGVRASERIIVGAYVDGHGGVCPMLAAHRCGGRTDFLSFARVVGPLHARRGASARAGHPRASVRILIGQLEDSLAERRTASSCDRAHRASTARASSPAREREQRDPTRRDRRRRAPRGDDPRRAAMTPPGRAYSESPGRMNMISGTTHAGEVLSR